jgi:hypothetical protein
MINLDIPLFTRKHYESLMRTLDPIEEYRGWSVKDGGAFSLGPLIGSKVRQCLHVVHEHLADINYRYKGGILTGAGLPSPQIPIVAGVAKYFRLKCAVTTPKYDNEKRDSNRINASLAQQFGASVYGVGNPNPSGYEKDAKELCQELGYFQIKFGMFGDLAMEPVIEQVQNLPDYVRRIVIISGSGLSALSVLRGIVRYQKPVAEVCIVTLSGHYAENKRKWYDNLPEAEKFTGKVTVVPSEYPYRAEHRFDGTYDFDVTYESKAAQYMVNTWTPSRETAFWVVGRRVYDQRVIQPINWLQSAHERTLRTVSPSLF